MTRFRCWLLGCYMPHESVGQRSCERCGTWCEEPGYRNCSITRAIYWLVRGIVLTVFERLPVNRCGHCKRWFIGRDVVCSEECLRDWTPF